MFEKIITVTLNPALDATLWLNSLDFVEPNDTEREVLYAGGKGVNISRVLASLEIRARAYGICGNDNAGRFLSLLESDGVDFDFIRTEGAVRENLTINIPNGRFLKINRKGSMVPVEAMRQLRQKLEEELSDGKAALMVFAGSLPPNVTPEGYKALILSFRRENVKFALDNAFFRLEDLQEIQPFVVKPNLLEFRKMSGSDLRTEQSIVKLARSMTGYVEHTLVSLGAKGMIYAGSGGVCRLHNQPVPVKSTMGAGDTALAAFLTGLQRGMAAQEAARYAVAAGSASVTLEGTDIVTPAMVERFLPEVSLRILR